VNAGRRGRGKVEPEQRDVPGALGTRRQDIMLKVGLPRAMPSLFASLKIAISDLHGQLRPRSSPRNPGSAI
jgi:ABC-type proline/glycine betaine transport system permease subunit